ncbi:hypothetical protein OG394_39450 [Kribbella sp. NBC_01245]|uniref:hypothetical protein n=1 Tax=Kribbella sp. NBC_01245 TaxID=2903578 RepID=UPI002E2D0593|nr:hypothetical protein [Kribbella sp. NBC_01245]
MSTGRPVSRDSDVYREFERLYRAARELQPSDLDRWNGDLETVDGKWGGLAPDGTMRLNEQLVLNHLDPQRPSAAQASALTTVYHEALHGRVPIDAPLEPNAFRGRESKALNEGLTEYAAVRDTDIFAASTGYGHVTPNAPEYPAAHAATRDLLNYAANSPTERNALVDRALAQPVVMRWDVIADHIVRTRLDGVVPADPAHQQAARAELVNAMANNSWHTLEEVNYSSIGEAAATSSIEASNQAIGRIEQHYQQFPNHPYPSASPNPAALQAPSQGIAPTSGQSISQAAGPQVNGEQERRFASPEMRAPFAGQAPAAGAVQTAPKLGNGSRAQTGPAGPTKSLGPRDPTDRGRD